jgi:hypothetical protein
VGWGLDSFFFLDVCMGGVRAFSFFLVWGGFLKPLSCGGFIALRLSSR